MLASTAVCRLVPGWQIQTGSARMVQNKRAALHALTAMDMLFLFVEMAGMRLPTIPDRRLRFSMPQKIGRAWRGDMKGAPDW